MSKHTGFVKGKGLLVVLSGFSGAGKSTLTKKLLAEYDYAYSVSATTRKPREGEVDGKDYYFVDRETFEKLIAEDALLEYNEYVGNFYGTPKEPVLGNLENGRDVILEIDVNGARQIRKQYPEAVLIFVTAPSAKELAERLSGRGTESVDVVIKRLTQSIKEKDDALSYDYLIINDDLEETAKHLNSLIQDQHMRLSQQGKYLDDFVKEMKDLLASLK